MRALFFRKYEHSTKHISLQPIQDLYLNLMAISFAGARGGEACEDKVQILKVEKTWTSATTFPPYPY